MNIRFQPIGHNLWAVKSLRNGRIIKIGEIAKEFNGPSHFLPVEPFALDLSEIGAIHYQMENLTARPIVNAIGAD